MHIKARLLFGLYIFCLHVALPKRYFRSCNGMMRHCRKIGLWIFVMDKSQCRRSSEYYASSITKTIFCLPWDYLRKILPECQQMASVPNGIETLPKISIAWVGCTNVTDRQTDGRPMTYSEREREFTFAKNETLKPEIETHLHFYLMFLPCYCMRKMSGHLFRECF